MRSMTGSRGAVWTRTVLVFGSFIGWVIALVWAFTEVKPRDPSIAAKGLSDFRKGAMIVLAIAGLIAFAIFIICSVVLLSGTPAAPFVDHCAAFTPADAGRSVPYLLSAGHPFDLLPVQDSSLHRP